MCCGVAQNAYHTLRSLTFVLPSGTVIDTSAADADDQLRAREPALWAGLKALVQRVRDDASLSGRIRTKYRTQEHDWLLAERAARLRAPGRRLRAPAGRRRGHAGVHRGGGARHRARPAREVHGAAAVPDDPRRVRRHRSAARRWRRGARSDGPRVAALGRDGSRAFHQSSRRCRRARPACSSSSRPPRRPPVPISSGWRPTRRAACACSHRPGSRTRPPSRPCSGRSARACSRPSARCDAAGRR